MISIFDYKKVTKSGIRKSILHVAIKFFSSRRELNRPRRELKKPRRELYRPRRGLYVKICFG